MAKVCGFPESVPEIQFYDMCLYTIIIFDQFHLAFGQKHPLDSVYVRILQKGT